MKSVHCEIKFSIIKMIFKCIFTVSSFVHRLQKVYGRVRVWLRLFEGLERLMVCLFMGLRRSVDSLLLGSPFSCGQIQSWVAKTGGMLLQWNITWPGKESSVWRGGSAAEDTCSCSPDLIPSTYKVPPSSLHSSSAVMCMAHRQTHRHSIHAYKQQQQQL